MDANYKSWRWPNVATIAAGSVSAFLGFVVLLGWHSRTYLLAQFFSGHSTPMQYNFAFGFFVGGMGLIFVGLNRFRWSLICASALTLVGGLTLLQHLLNADIGIDYLFVPESVFDELGLPGRMAANAALCYTLAGISLALASRKKWIQHSLPLVGTFGLMIAGLGLVAFSGHLANIETAYGWGKLSQMSAHAAAGLTVIGMGLFAHAWRESTEGGRLPYWLPAPVGIVGFTVSICLWQALSTQEKLQIQRTMRGTMTNVSEEITTALAFQTKALTDLATRSAMDGEDLGKYWDINVKLYVKNLETIPIVAWISPNFQVQEISHSTKHNRDHLTSLVDHYRVRKTLENAKQTQLPTLTRSISILGSNPLFSICAPSYLNHEFSGWVLGIFDTTEFIEASLGSDVFFDMSVMIYDGNQMVFLRELPNSDRDSRGSEEVVLPFNGTRWLLKMWPSQELLDRITTIIPTVTFAVGNTTTILVVLVVYLALTARSRADKLEVTNQELGRRIIDKERAEEALRKSREQLDRAATAGNIGLWSWDITTNEVFFSSLWKAQLGYTDDEISNQFEEWKKRFHPEDRDRMLTTIQKYLDKPWPHFEEEFRLQHKDGSYRWILAHADLRVASNGKPYLMEGSQVDITERKKLERQVLEISDHEQQRIGQDLHDGLGQQLTGIAFMSKVLEQKLRDKSAPEASDASDLAAHVKDAISQTRRLARGLHPVSLERDGLGAALKELTTNAEEVFGISCPLEHPDPLPLNNQIMASHLYRIAQEALNNAIKHGKAKVIAISIVVEDDKLLLTVTDDGVGLPKEIINPGMGLKIMEYRARMMDTTLHLSRGSKGGTVVSCSVSLSDSAPITG